MAKKRNATKKTPRKFNFSLSVPGLFFSCAFVFLALVWAFILGVIVGRGYYPQSLVLDEQQVSRQKDREQKLKSREDKVLKPEELGFYDSLSQTANLNGEKPDSTGSNENSKSADRNEQNNANRELQERDKQKVNKYKYTYQVAAFRDKEKADRLRIRINQAGLDTILKKVRKDNKIWYRTFVTFKGSPEDKRIVEEKLLHLGLGNFFLQEKRPLNP